MNHMKLQFLLLALLFAGALLPSVSARRPWIAASLAGCLLLPVLLTAAGVHVAGPWLGTALLPAALLAYLVVRDRQAPAPPRVREEPEADPEEREELEALREHFTDGEIWDIVTTVGFYNLSNRLATALDMRPNDEFYDLGRDQT